MSAALGAVAEGPSIDLSAVMWYVSSNCFTRCVGGVFWGTTVVRMPVAGKVLFGAVSAIIEDDDFAAKYF